MKANIKPLYILTLLTLLQLALGLPLYAQTVPDSIPAGTPPAQVRNLNETKLQELRSSEDFRYYEPTDPGDSFLDKAWYKFKQWVKNTFFKSGSGKVWEYLLYILLAVAIVFIILKLMKMDETGMFGKSNSKGTLPYEVLEEDIHAIDFEQLLAEAEQHRDFRKAIRLHYLQSLKRLTDRDLINWSPGKTNRSYLPELTDPALRREFSQLTGMFEYVWYGGAALGDELYASAKEEFAAFNKLLQQRA